MTEPKVTRDELDELRHQTDLGRQINRALEGLHATTDALVAVARWAKAQDPPDRMLLDQVQSANRRFGDLMTELEGIARVLKNIEPPPSVRPPVH